MAQWLHQIAEWFRCWSETIEHVTVAAASVIGGVWVLFRFLNERTLESALTIGVDTSTIAFDGTPLTFVDVTLTNVGKVRLQAKPVDRSTAAYDDGVEKLQHSCDLSIRKLLSDAKVADNPIDWFNAKSFDSSKSLELNLLNEYEDPRNNNRVDFWMEPGEEYHLGVSLRLDAGVYLAKVTFIGARSDDEFWSRIVMVEL
jgi:hypothetical protein